MRAAARELEMELLARLLEHDAVEAVVIEEAADLLQTQSARTFPRTHQPPGRAEQF